MKIQASPNAWSCLPTALAMALDIPVRQVFDGIGHDGSEIIFEDYPEPQCRRGFHTTEIIFYALKHHEIVISLLPLAVRLWSVDQKVSFDLYSNEEQTSRVKYLLGYYPLVILEPTHAVAWDGGMVYDPKGYTRHISSLRIQHILFW